MINCDDQNRSTDSERPPEQKRERLGELALAMRAFSTRASRSMSFKEVVVVVLLVVLLILLVVLLVVLIYSKYIHTGTLKFIDGAFN